MTPNKLKTCVMIEGMEGDRATSVSVRYGGALALAVLALVLRAFLADYLVVVPYLFSYFAVLTAARYFGMVPSILVVVVGVIGIAPALPTMDWTRLILFVGLSALMISIVEVFRRARSEAERNARLAAERSKQLESEIVQSAQLRAIVESSEDAIVSKNLAGVIESWNQGAQQVFGYSPAEAIGQPIPFLLPADRLDEERDLMERIRLGGRVKHFETVRLRKDGIPIHVSLTVSPIRGPDGSIIGISNIARDITDRKQFEEEMLQRQKSDSLIVLAGGLAHDFNNLLTGIMGNASLAMAEIARPELACQRLGEVLQASDRAAQLVRQMLAYAGKGRFHVVQFDLNQEINEILPLLGATVPKFVDIQLVLAKDLPAIEADRSQMQQLVMNLATNAAEAIGDRPGTIAIRTSHRKSEVILEVADDGCGMTDDVRERIFDPFYTTKFTGRGLGLAAVMGIIRAHRGTISVSTAPGKGTTMTVVLPAVAGVPAAEKAENDGDLTGIGLILVADDEELVRNMAKFTLESHGYSIETAGDGRETLDKFRSRPREYAAVLLDLTMPTMHGEEVLRAIREIRQDVPVVLSSGYTESEALARFDDLNLAGFLQKPYTATDLASKIKKAVTRFH
jgi:PAS domain S-box-containing protein